MDTNHKERISICTHISANEALQREGGDDPDNESYPSKVNQGVTRTKVLQDVAWAEKKC